MRRTLPRNGRAATYRPPSRGTTALAEGSVRAQLA